MKKISFLLIIALATVICISCKEKKGSGKVKEQNLVTAKERDNTIKKGAAAAEFDKTSYDFGTVIEGEVIETTFVITNTGKTDLVITDAQATCGCTVAAWPKEPIKSGTSGEIQVTFNTAGKPNRQSKDITLYTNTATGREVVRIFGNVIPKTKK